MMPDMMTDRNTLDCIRNIIDFRIQRIDAQLIKVGNDIVAWHIQHRLKTGRILDNDYALIEQYGYQRSELTQERRQLEIIRDILNGQKPDKAIEKLFIEGGVMSEDYGKTVLPL